MKKITLFQVQIIIMILGFVVFQFLSVRSGQKGDIGFAIGFATISISYIIILSMTIILEKIHRDKDETDN